VELERVDRVTAGAVGEPGHRTFYVQARHGEDVVTVLVEKQQVQLLSSSIYELLRQLEVETGDGPADDELQLEEPLEPMWRVGRLSIGYHEENDLMLLELEELVDEPEEGGEVTPIAEAQLVRLWATREQMRALARHGAEVVAAGRPLCQFCGNPLDPEGHVCPAMNGHGSPST
jgi:uncharacterized repeat protein (TIGR03847 family)